MTCSLKNKNTALKVFRNQILNLNISGGKSNCFFGLPELQQKLQLLNFSIIILFWQI